MASRLHVVPHEQGWAVKRENARDNEAVFGTQKEAITAAKDLAENDESDVVIHRSDGTIRNMITYESNGNGERKTRVQPEDIFSVGSRISWGAVIAGAVVAITVYLTFSVLAVAMGLSLYDDVGRQTFNIGAAIAATVLLLASMFIGGYIVTRTTTGETTAEAIIYGLALWGVLYIGVAVLASLGLGIGTATAAFAGGDGQALTGGPAPAAAGERQPAEGAGGAEGAAAARGGAARVHPSDLTPQERETASAAAWWMFFGMLLSLGAAVLGALAGAGPTFSFVRRPVAGSETTVSAART